MINSANQDELDALNQFGKSIRRLREARGWTFLELSNKSGVYSTSVICRVEVHEGMGCNLLTAIRLAKAFGVSIDDMIRGTI